MAQPTPADAKTFLASKAVTRTQRIDLARLAAVEAAWAECDQAIQGNVDDLVAKVVEELYEPYWCENPP